VQQTFRSYCILVLEDDSGDAQLIQEAFADCGKACLLTFARDIQHAKQLLQSGTFDLVISDMGFRNEQGADLIRELRADPRLRSVPVIVISGSPDPRPAYEAGANAFVSKAPGNEGLFAKLKALMHFWMEVVELPRVPTAP
jgi:CheY-like chemotaxis protein